MSSALPSVSRQARFAAVAGAMALALCAFAGAASAQRADDCILDRCGDRIRPAPSRPNAPGADNPRPTNPRAENPDDPSIDDAPPRSRYRNDYGDRGRGRDAPRGRNYGSAPGGFDFYVLSLSWSPSFCATTGAQRRSRQCDFGQRLGFVLHGLWPQYDRGFPSYCDDRPAPRMAIENARGVFPEDGLARYEWRKHGTCSGLAPAAYFEAARAARDKVVIPEPFRSGQAPQNIDPREVERAFLEANRTLRPGMLAVTCNRGMLEEVRVCLSKDLRQFQPCPEVARSACRVGDMRVPAPR